MRLTFRLGGALEIGRLGFGAMHVGDTPSSGARLELGVGLIDRADVYGTETSELLIAEALHPYPAGLVIATKGGLNRLRDRLRDGRPEYLRSAREPSLRRLRLVRIDLDSLHRHDPEVPIEESVGALEELRQEGKTLLIGLSSLARAAATQTFGRPGRGGAEREQRRLPRLQGCAAGVRGGRDRLHALGPLGEGLGGPALELASLLERSPVIVPISGTPSVAQLEENMSALSSAALPPATTGSP
ncbi:MAG: aldo/keto reductase [Gaiellaceae bacterium]